MAEGKAHADTVKEEGVRQSEGSRTTNNSSCSRRSSINNNNSNNSASSSNRESQEAIKGQQSQSRGQSNGSSNSSSSNNNKKKRAAAVSQQSASAQREGGGGREDKKKTVEQQTLREQLEKLVSHKLATSGDLDHAGLLALETLSKLPAAPGSEQSGAGASGAPAGAGAGLPRSRSFLPPGIETLPKFSGKDPSQLTDILNRFHSLVIAALPGATPAQKNKALNRDVVFVLEGSALKFFNSLKAGQIDWEPVPPAPESQQGGQEQQQQQQPQPGKPPFRPPSTWAELHEAFHDHYLPAEGIARTSETLFSLNQAAGETVPSLAQRQLGLTHHLNRLIEAHGGQTTFWEAITIRLFERALRADLRRLQQAEPPCLTFQESVDRAERNATNLQKNVAKQSNDANGRGGGEGHAGNGVAQGNSSIVHTKGKVEEPKPSRSSPTTVANAKGPIAALPTRRDGVAAPGNSSSSNGTAVRRNARPHPGEASPTANGGPPPLARKDSSPQHVEDPDDNADEGGSLRDGAWQEDPDVRANGGRGKGGGGEIGEDRRFVGKRNHTKKQRGSHKRMRDWREDHNASNGQHHQPFLPHHRPWPVDPNSVPPCRLPQCKTINRQFHASNDCYWHFEYGEQNRENGRRKKRHPPSRENSMAGPDERFHNGFGFQGPPQFNPDNFDGNQLY